MTSGDIVAASAGIDPLLYPPPFVAPRACDFNRFRATQAGSPCPHFLPDVLLWEDAATWGWQVRCARQGGALRR